MWLIDALKNRQKADRSKYRSENSHNFSDEDREASEMKRTLRSIRRERLEHLRQMVQEQNTQEEIDSLEDQLFGESNRTQEQNPGAVENSPSAAPSFDSLAMAIIASLFMKNSGIDVNTLMPGMSTQAQGQITGGATQVSPVIPPKISDEQIKQLILEIPEEHRKKAKNWKDERILFFVGKIHPELDQETLIRGLKIFRGLEA